MEILIWILFIVSVLAMLALDLGLFHRGAKVITIGQAASWTTVWVLLALLFNAGVYFLYEHHVGGLGQRVGHELDGKQAALQFFTGYVIEKSLSLDNIFVIALTFSYFRIEARYQHRVLFWGILGALVMRGVMIAAGTALVTRFTWMNYVFGGLLILTAVKMLVARHDNLTPERNPFIRLARKVYPVSDDVDGPQFFTKVQGRRAMTPLFLVLIVVESTDLLFALDSIPAIFAVTRDPFLVFTSNIFAILGLRSLYFVLGGVMDRFRYLKTSLVFLLAFVGVKMLLAHHYPIPILVSLGVISGILAVGVLASLLDSHRDTAALPSPLGDRVHEVLAYTRRQLVRVIVLLLVTTTALVVLAMMFLPGPAVIVIPAGVALLGAELLWARGVLARSGGAPPPPDPAPSDANTVNRTVDR